MTGTSTDLTGPRPSANSPVYAVFGTIDPAAATITDLLDAGMALRQVPLDLVIDLDCGITNLREPALDQIRRLGSGPLLGAVGFDDWWTDALAALNPGFRLAEARRLVTDKGLLYTKLAEHDVPVPQLIRGRLDPDFIERAIAAFGPRPILKPATGAGSRGVYRYRDDLPSDDNLLLYRRFLAVGHIDSTVEILATEYLGGAHAIEVSVDTITAGGQVRHQVVHEKLTSTDVHPFVDRVMVSPAVNPTIGAAGGDLTATVAATIKAIGLTDGAAHLELRLHNERWHVLDIGIRPGSGLVAHSVTARSGIDPRAVHVLTSIGQPISTTKASEGELAAATCIACCYLATDARRAASFAAHQALAERLDAAPEVFGWHLNGACTDDRIYQPDAGLSIGVGDAHPDAALRRLRAIVEPFGYSPN